MGPGTTLDTVTLRLEADDSDLNAGLRQAEVAWQAAGRRMQDVGNSLKMNLTLPLAATGAAALYTAAEFDKAMRRITALAGVPQTQVDAWRASVRQLAVDYGISAKEVALALEGITRSGTKGTAAIDALRVVVQASAAGLAPLATMTSLVTAALDAYQRQGLTASRATEILASGVRNGTLRLEEFGPVLSRVNGAAAALGVSFADVVGTLAVFAQSGAEPNEAASQLLAVMNALLRTSDPAAKALSRAGLSVEELRAQGQGTRGLVVVVRMLDEAFKGNSDRLIEVVPNLGGFRAVMNALAQDSTRVNATLDAISGSSGNLAAALAASDGPAKSLTKALQSVKDALIGIGSTVVAPTVVPAISGIAKAIEAVGDRIEAAPKWFQTMTAAFGGMGIAVGPAILGLGRLGDAFQVVDFALNKTTQEAFQKVRVAFAAGPLIAFKNGLDGIRASATLLMTNPLFLAATAIAIGLGIITSKWLEMRLEVQKTAQAIRDSATAMDEFLGNRTPEQAAKQLPLMMERRRAMAAQMVEAQRERDRLKAWRDERFDGAVVKDEWTGRINWAEANKNRTDLAAAEARLSELQANMTELRRQYNILAARAGQPRTPDPTVDPPTTTATMDLDVVKDAMDGLNAKLNQTRDLAKLLGTEFNATEAEAQAYADAINDLTAAGVPLDATLDDNGTTIRDLAGMYTILSGHINDTRKAQENLADIYNMAAGAVRDAMTPQEKYAEVIRSLEIALRDAKISQDEFNKAVERAKEVLAEATDQTAELKQALLDMVSRSVDGFIDMVFEGKQSFGEFVESALRDLAKLILKLELMRWLVGEGLKGGSFGGLLGTIGGMMLPGGASAATAAGPELLTRIAPNMNPALRAAGSASAAAVEAPMPVTINVNALDRRDVAAFFEENESLVAMALLRARNRSAALRRTLSNGG